MKAKITDFSIDYASGRQKLSVVFSEREDFRGQYDALHDREIDTEISEHKERRSNNANKYLWELIGRIALKLGIGNEECYRQYVRDMGVYDIFPVREDAAERFCEAWKRGKIGWITERMERESKIPGYVNIVAYYGTAVYNREEFSRLLNQVIEDCKAQGIPTRPQEETDALVEAYFGKIHSAEK